MVRLRFPPIPSLFKSEARIGLQKLLDDHSPPLQPSLPPTQGGAFDDVQSSSQRSFVFPYSTRTRPTSPCGSEQCRIRRSFLLRLPRRALRLTANHVWELSIYSLLPAP